MSIRVAINGFGRIGRSVLRVLLDREDFVPVAVNDRHPAHLLAPLFRYDSVHGPLGREVQVEPERLRVAGRDIRVFTEADPARLPWRELGVDVVVEATGVFTVGGGARRHLDAGAGRVVISAVSADADIMVVLGVNAGDFDPALHRVVSNGSCTTNALAILLKVVHEKFGVARGLVTTLHPYTNAQPLLDHAGPDPRLSRAGALSLVPTVTHSPRGLGAVLPALEGRLDGVSVRVPTAGVTLADVTLDLERETDASALNAELQRAAGEEMAGYLGYTEEPLVSVDFVRCPLSAVVDGPQTRVAGGTLAKLTAWYDNEWGYANRVVELISYMASDPKPGADR